MNSAQWAGRSIFITGHTGFKGAWLCVLLERLGATVHGYALDTPDGFLFNRAGLSRIIETDARGDIRDVERLTAAIARAQPEIVLHLAAQSLVRESYLTPRETFSVNVDGTLSVLEAARAVDSVRAVVAVTTDKVYRNDEWHWGYREIDPLGGDDPYSASKAAAELAAHSFAVSYPRADFAIATARAGNVIGGGDATPDALVPELVGAFRAGRAPVIRRPGARRPWQHALEPLSGYLALAEALLDRPELHDTAWNFGPAAEDGLTVAEFAAELGAHWGEASDWTLDAEAGPHEAGLLMVDSARARAELGWRPRWRVQEAIAAVAEWEQAIDHGVEPLTVTRRQVEQYLVGQQLEASRR
ncbi:CDP-glucose 4,6-dehydratase [Gryllotalpicola reticulitermitis]|uniref:CDP-glucose 4,6-dehydratase n=1 Tax=Gryllotalpicola reticulitermitis TaxID=1184153 RepID=A0ABV8Q5T5_9MICO